MDATESILTAALAQQPPPQAPAPAAAAPPVDATTALLQSALAQSAAPHPGWRANGTDAQWYDPTGNFPTPGSWDAAGRQLPQQQSAAPQPAPPPQQAGTGAGGGTPAPQGSATATPQPTPSMWDDIKAYGQGIANSADPISMIEESAGELGARATDATGLTKSAYPWLHQVFDESNHYNEDPNNKYSQGGHAVGRLMATAPLAAVAPFGGSGFASSVANSAAQGGLGAALTSPDHGGSLPSQIGMGMAFGGALAPVGYGLSSAAKLGSALLKGSAAPAVTSAQSTAARILLGALDSDSIAPGAAAGQMRSDPTGQLTLADVGGENSATQRLARALVTAPGPASKQITGFLSARDAGQSGRVLSTINQNLVNSPDALQLGDALQSAKMEQARPLYEAAGVPSNPDDYPSAPVMNTNRVKALIAKSSAIQSVIKRAKALPQFVDLADTSMPILDQVYKGVGDDAATAAKFGNGTEAFNLGHLRDQVLDAITDGDPDHPYQQALNAYSGGADSQKALELGQKAFGQPAAQVQRNLETLRDSDKDFFRIGFGSTLQQKLNNAGDGRDAVKVIYGNDNIRSSIGHVFGEDAAARFDQAMGSEQRMDQTSNFVTSGSQTANKLGDLVKQSAVKKLIGDSIAGGAGGLFLGGLHGAMIGASLPLVNAGKDLLTSSAQKSPLSDSQTAAALADMLMKPGSAGASAFEAAVNPALAAKSASLARNKKLAAVLSATAPAAGIAGGAYVSGGKGN